MCLISFRPDLLRSDGIPSMDPLPSPSVLSVSPKVSTPPSKTRYRSKPRHRRANSKGSHNEFLGVLKSAAGAPEDTQSLQEQHYHHHRQQQQPAEGPFLPLKGREEAVVNCANNLRYFGPAAALRSPQTDHLQRRVSGSSPDLISTAVDADTRQRASSTSSSLAPGAGDGASCPCCQAHPFPGCHCQQNPPASSLTDGPQYSLLCAPEGLLSSSGAPSQDLSAHRDAATTGEQREQEAAQNTHTLPTALPRNLRPLRKVKSSVTQF